MLNILAIRRLKRKQLNCYNTIYCMTTFENYKFYDYKEKLFKTIIFNNLIWDRVHTGDVSIYINHVGHINNQYHKQSGSEPSSFFNFLVFQIIFRDMHK